MLFNVLNVYFTVVSLCILPVGKWNFVDSLEK